MNSRTRTWSSQMARIEGLILLLSLLRLTTDPHTIQQLLLLLLSLHVDLRDLCVGHLRRMTHLAHPTASASGAHTAHTHR